MRSPLPFHPSLSSAESSSALLDRDFPFFPKEAFVPRGKDTVTKSKEHRQKNGRRTRREEEEKMPRRYRRTAGWVSENGRQKRLP